MAVEFKDYYKILGVTKSATHDDIRKAFRQLARKYHPDVVEASKKAEAEERFKEINEAYEVLGDEQKRRQYDELGANWNRGGAGGGMGGGMGGFPGGFQGSPGQGGGFDFGGDASDFSDFFEQFFGGAGARGAGGGINMEDLFGGGGGGTRGMGQPRSRKGGDLSVDVLVSLEEALHGTTRAVKFRKQNPNTGEVEHTSLNVKIPAGVRPGQKVRVPGQGRPGDPNGDLFLNINFARHPDFTILENGDLSYSLELAPWEAILGTTVRLPTPDGPVDLKIKAGMESGKKLRLRGKGLLKADKQRADLLVTITVQVPETVTAEEEELWRKLAEISSFKPHT